MNEKRKLLLNKIIKREIETKIIPRFQTYSHRHYLKDYEIQLSIDIINKTGVQMWNEILVVFNFTTKLENLTENEKEEKESNFFYLVKIKFINEDFLEIIKKQKISEITIDYVSSNNESIFSLLEDIKKHLLYSISGVDTYFKIGIDEISIKQLISDNIWKKEVTNDNKRFTNT